MFGLSLTVCILVGFASAGNIALPDQKTCSRGGCKNPCEARGLACCFCDQTVSWSLDACFCCPTDHFCCPVDTWASISRAHCCPKGYSCTKNARCTKNVDTDPTIAEGVCSTGCRKDTTLYITVDDTFTLFIDGKKQPLTYPDDWVNYDVIDLPGTAEVITVCAKNIKYKAGILAATLDPSVLETAEWKCYSSLDRCEDIWSSKTYDDAHWGPAYDNEKNDGKDTRKDIVKKIPQTTYFKWCNNPQSSDTEKWNPYCTCRIKLNGKKVSYAA